MLTSKFSLSLLMLLIVATLVQGQQKFDWKETASGGYTYRYVANDPMKVRFYTLKNGLSVILSPNNKEPRIKSLIAVRAGSNSDPKEHTGLAHYLEHLLFKGTYAFGSLDSISEKKYIAEIENLYDVYNHTTDPAERKLIYHQIDSVSGIAAKYTIPNEYDKMMTSMGSQGTNAHTSVEETVYEENIPSNAVDKFLAVQAERFRNPVFRLFHTELEAVYEEKNRSLDNDMGRAWETILSELFPTHNYGQQTTIGTVEHLKNPSLKAIREFYNTYYVPGNMAIIMAGDFNPDELVKKIDKAFAYMKPAPVKEYKGPAEAPLTAPIIKEVTGPDAEVVGMAYRLPGVSDYSAAVTGAVVGQLLNNGKAGLMDINLNKQQKVLSSNGGVQYWKDYSFFSLSGQAKEGQSLEEVRDLLLSQIDLLRKGQYDETLIKAIVSNFKLSELQGLQSNDNRVNALMQAYIQHKGLMWNKDVSFVDDMAKVTKQQVMDYANTYLGNNYVAVFKRKGEKKDQEKVDKPVITPVVLNRDATSAFARKVENIPANAIHPVWLDFEKEISKSRAGIADVLYVQNKENDIFRLYYRFDIGSWNNRELGLAAGYLQFLGNGKYSAEEISRQFYNIACNFSVSPGTENTTITVTGLQENFNQAVKLLESLITNCVPDESALANLKARILKSRADSKLSKDNIAKGLSNYAIYGAKNPFNYQFSAEELNAITSKQLVDILHNIFKFRHTIIYYGPKPIAGIVKDIQAAHVIPGSFAPDPVAVKFDKKDMTSNRVLFAPYTMVQSEITWLRNADKYNASEVPLITLYNSYFGGGMGSVVFQTIRESKALAYSTYSVFAQADKKEGRSTMVAYVGSQADKMNEAVAAMNELLTDLPKTEKGLQAAKESILQDIASDRITQDGIIFSYLSAKKLGLATDIRRKIYETVGGLGYEELKKFHQQEVAGKPYTYCIVASPEKISMDDLKKIGEVEQLSLEQLFGY